PAERRAQRAPERTDRSRRRLPRPSAPRSRPRRGTPRPSRRPHRANARPRAAVARSWTRRRTSPGGPSGRVRAVVPREELVERHMGVALGGGEARMTEELLDHAEVGAPLEQVRRAAMPESVRVQIRAPRSERAVALDELLHPAHAEASPSSRQEQRAPTRCGAPRTKLAATREVRLERRTRFAAERHDALLVPLPEHAHLRRLELDVLQIQPHELAHPEPRAVEQLEKRRVARALCS